MMEGSDIYYDMNVAARLHPKELIAFVMGGKPPESLKKDFQDRDIKQCRQEVFDDLELIFSIRVEAIKDEDQTVHGGIQDFLLEMINVQEKDKGKTRDFKELYGKCQGKLLSSFQISQLFETKNPLLESFVEVMDECKQNPKAAQVYFAENSSAKNIKKNDERDILEKTNVLNEMFVTIPLNDIMEQNDLIQGFSTDNSITFGEKVMEFFEKIAGSIIAAFNRLKYGKEASANNFDDIFNNWAKEFDESELNIDSEILPIMNQESQDRVTEIEGGRGM